jgi:pimeloyl-ACP methyl ester carboxylesterase
MQHFVTDDGERVFYRVSGSGPPLVLLHEWGSSHRIWEPLAGLLQASFTVYRWDARGHGGHPARGSEAPSVSRMAKDLAAFLDHLRMDKPIVVGASMGALTLWEYIRRHGCHRLSGICVVDQSPRLRTDATWSLGIYGHWPPDRDAAFVSGLETDFVDTVLRLIAFGNNRQARESYEANGPGTRRLRAYLATLDPKPLIAIWRSLTEADYRSVLPAITVPALLVYGSESNYYGVETARYVQRSTPGAALHIYEGADHSPHVCQPRRFVADLQRFAARIHPTRAGSSGTAPV